MKKNVILHLLLFLCNFVYADKLVINDSDLSTCIALESNMFEFVKGKIYSMRIDESNLSTNAILKRMAQFNCHHEDELDDYFEMARLVSLLCVNKIDVPKECFSVVYKTILFIVCWLPDALSLKDCLCRKVGDNFNSKIWAQFEQSAKVVVNKLRNNMITKSDMIKFVKE